MLRNQTEKMKDGVECFHMEKSVRYAPFYVYFAVLTLEK